MPIYALVDTWNAAGTTFTGIGLNVTDTASAAGSLLLDLQVGGTSRFKVDKTGDIVTNGASITTLPNGTWSKPSAIEMVAGGHIRWENRSRIYSGSDGNLTFYNFGFSNTVELQIEAADTLAQRRGTNAQAFRISNTHTDASNFERGFMRWSSNVLQIGTEKAGTGTARALELQTDGLTALTIATNAIVTTSRSFNAAGGTFYVDWATGNLTTYDNGMYGWTGSNTAVGTSDLTLRRDAADTLAQRRGTNAQAFRVYNTFTDVSNFERIFFGFSSNTAALVQDAAGTGSARVFVIGNAGASPLRWRTNSTDRWEVTATGNLLAYIDNTYDIGATNATRPRDVHIAGYVAVGDGITAPGAGTGEARIYVDTADGDLKVVFADGTVKTIVTDT
jgi:hypothetical protein